jgi:hypothetical protein
MGKKTEKNPVGRPSIKPRAKLDMTMLETVEKMAIMQCTQEEIASFLGISYASFKNHKEFLAKHRKGIESGKASLRRMQWKSAQDGNVTSQIWLGKQYLGQRDKNELTGEGGGPLKGKIEIEFVNAGADT